MPSSDAAGASAWRSLARALPFLLPAILFTLLVFIVPLWSVLERSLYPASGFGLGGYRTILSSALFGKVLYNTFNISLTSTLTSLLIAYPMAYHISRQTPRYRAFLIALVLLPFWTSILVKSFALMILLGRTGLANQLVTALGFDPLPLLFNRFGAIVGTTHHLVPFVMFPILTSLLAQDRNLHRAAALMGAGRLRIFLRVTLPLSFPGIAAGCLLALIQSFGFFITIALLGGRADITMANLVDMYTREILDWNLASTIAVILFAIAACCIALLALAGQKPGAQQEAAGL